MQVLLDILDGRPFVEDCCDTMGGYYDGLHVGNFGTVAAFSFYGSHHITTAGVGGALVTTHWGRTDYDDLDSLNDPYGKFEKRYWYETLGADYQMTEFEAAFGIVQMARLDKRNSVRIDRFLQLNRFLSRTGFERFFYMPYTDSDEAAPSWFAYPLTIKPDAPFGRREFATHLIENKIEIRPLFTGNVWNI
jgi:CDP-6-deoxy-D-xylo-4-hexulose-3-dehydrase